MTSTSGSTTGGPPPLEVWDAHRGVLHVHSPFSHDACDGEGLMGGVPNEGCVADLRAAICAAGLDFVNLTDHPAYMKDYPFEALLLLRGGDQVIVEDGMPVANRIKCPNDHVALVTVGYEATHTLPLGLHHHVAAEFYGSLVDADAVEVGKALVAALQAGGAVVGIAHSEEADLSAGRIVEVGLDAMEWYNPHGNFKTALGGDSIAGDPAVVLELIQGLLPFMAGSKSGAHPDLVYLRLLPKWPVEGFAKWREVLRSRPITGLFGSDVHQNVKVDPICEQKDPVLKAACLAAANAVLPPALAGLVSGGTLTMADGERLDSYLRIFRWLENRVLLAPGEVLTMAALQDGLREGRSFGVFSVFGDPSGFAFVGDGEGGSTVQLGGSVAGPTTLHVQAPVRPEPLGAGGPSWEASEGEQATIRAVLVHTDAGGSAEVAMIDALGGRLDFAAEAAGAYHVEVWVRPGHLKKALGSEDALAEVEYLWVITNPIYVAG